MSDSSGTERQLSVHELGFLDLEIQERPQFVSRVAFLSIDSSLIDNSPTFGSKLGPIRYDLARPTQFVPRYEEITADKDEFSLVETDLTWRKGIAGVASLLSLTFCSGFFYYLFQSFVVGIWSY